MNQTPNNKEFEGLVLKKYGAEVIEIDSSPKFQGTVVNKDDIMKENKTTVEIEKKISENWKESRDMTNDRFVTKDELKT